MYLGRVPSAQNHNSIVDENVRTLVYRAVQYVYFYKSPTHTSEFPSRRPSDYEYILHLLIGTAAGSDQHCTQLVQLSTYFVVS